MLTKKLTLITREHALKTALIENENFISYQELLLQAENIAKHFTQHGLTNKCIALHLSNSYELVLCYLACFLSGAIAVPINENLTTTEIKYIVESTQAKCIITHKALLEKIYPIPVSSKQIYVVNNSSHNNAEVNSFTELLKPSTTTLPVVGDKNPAMILFTSGSTGKPKGVVHSHATFLAICESMADACDINIDDCFLVTEPITNVSGCSHIFLTLIQAAQAIINPPLNTLNEFRNSLIKHKPTHICVMGKGNYDIINSPELSKDDFASVRYNLTGGDKITKDLLKSFQAKTGIMMRQSYGMSECLLITMNKSTAEQHLGSIGTICKKTSIKIIDDNNQPVALDKAGHLYVKGPHVMLGYWQDPETTTTSLIDGWLKTGDIVKVDQEGYYWFVGRSKNIIIRDGDNISPYEVEEVLAQHPAVNVVAVVAQNHPTEGQVPVAFVELKKTQQNISNEELIAFSKQFLEENKIPVAITIVKKLPRTANGKLARNKLTIKR